MTSKHCFFRIMHEDFRHKLWMLALSILGNMLAIPVVYLIGAGYREGVVSARSLTAQADSIAVFFGYSVMISGGIVAIAGALITGLAGFRYVFHRNMTDTYHSIPVRRRTLFFAGCLNGFLIWFVPTLICMGLTLLLGMGRLGTLEKMFANLTLNEQDSILASQWLTKSELAANTLLSLLALTIAFLVVYQTVLLAVMLCGNILNTLVMLGSIGGGLCAIYFLFVSFCEEYFNTFIYAVGNENVIYTSPLISSVILLYRRAELYDGNEAFSFGLACGINLAVALALGALAFLAYLKRPSELAEQGLRLKPVKFLTQIVVAFASAMAGWMLFYVIGESARLVWGIFGAVLAGVVTFGVLDIVFHMEFRAFFKHKALMGVTVAAGIFMGFLFYYDWLGYDRYLPDREEIVEIGIYDNLRSCSYHYGFNVVDAMHPLNQVHIKDSAAAYAFLESVVRRESAGDAAYPEETGGPGTSLQHATESMEEVLARVTLSNGKTYYRRYQVSSFNNGPAYALLATPEYRNVNFRIDPEKSGQNITVNLQRGWFQQLLQTNTQEGAEFYEAMREAYNQDLEENPEAFILGDGRLLCSIRVSDTGYSSSRYLEVFEGMEHTREALRQYGFGWLAEPVAAEDVQEIRLGLGYQYESGGDPSELIEAARNVYGVWQAEDSEADTGEISREMSAAQPYETAQPVYVTEDVANTQYREEDEKVLRILDKAEIEELLELISYDSGRFYGGGAFRPNQVEQVTIVFSEGEEELSVNIPEGALPEKYIQRFGMLAQ